MRLIQPRWFPGYFRGFRTSLGRSATWEILHYGLFPINRFTPWWKLLSCVQLFETPWTIAGQAPLSMGFSRQEYWGGLSFPSPGNLPDLGIESVSPALQADSLPSEPPGKPDDQQMQKKVLTKFGTHLWLKKKLQKVDVEGTHLNIIKAIFDKPSANIILSGEKLKAFSLRPEWDKGVHSPHFYSAWFWKSQRRKRNKRNPNWKRS